MSEDLLDRDFHADTPLSRCVTDMTEIPACDGKLYVSALFDCYDAGTFYGYEYEGFSVCADV